MQLRSGSFKDMAKELKEQNKKVALFGAGAIGAVVVPEILHSFGLDSYIDCYIDNDAKRWGEQLESSYTSKPVCSPEYLNQSKEDTIILLNISRYVEVLKQLEEMACTRNMVCYIVPMMLIHDYALTEKTGAIKDSNTPLIPKKIHYIWLGKKKIPSKLQYCIDSWKKYCPDYEIVRWDESNYDFHKNDYMRQAYEAGAYGFVPDYARLDILYTHGGIYMDTDVEVIKSLDDLLFQEAFCGVEKWQIINFGGCSGAAKGHPALKAFIQNREHLLYKNADGTFNRNTCGYYDTQVTLQHGYKLNGRSQKVMNMNIYSSDYFHPYDYMSGRTMLTQNTYSIHHFNGGWLDEKMREANIQASQEFEALYQKTLKED